MGKACAYLVKWSVTTRIFSCPLLDFSNDKKSIQTIGWWLIVFTNSAFGFGNVLPKIHSSCLCIQHHTLSQARRNVNERMTVFDLDLYDRHRHVEVLKQFL